MRLGEAPPPGSLDPIETASRDEIAGAATHAARLDAAPRVRKRAALPRALSMRQAFTRPIFTISPDLSKFPFTMKAGSA